MNQDLNIPIDIVRSVIVIAETGSISKAADRLSLSQPALSSQISVSRASWDASCSRGRQTARY